MGGDQGVMADCLVRLHHGPVVDAAAAAESIHQFLVKHLFLERSLKHVFTMVLDWTQLAM